MLSEIEPRIVPAGDSPAPTPEAELTAIEAQHGPIPAPYRELLAQHGPFRIRGFAEVFGLPVLTFYGGAEFPIEELYVGRERLADQGLVPFAVDPFGDLFCWSRKDQTIWFDGQEYGEGLRRLAPSLREFLDAITVSG